MARDQVDLTPIERRDDLINWIAQGIKPKSQFRIGTEHEKFGPSKQYGLFGSAGAAWIISGEKWFADALPFISFAKLRGSWGTQGGDAIPNYGYLTTFSKTLAAYQGSFGLAPFSLANPDLHWEHNTKTEGSLSLEFLKGRLFLDVTYYENHTSDQLISQPLPGTTGYTSFTLNAPALISNTGYEFVLNTRNLSTRDFSWTTSFNFSIQRNKLVSYPGLDKLGLNSSYVIGKSITGMKLYKYAGIDPQTGLRNYINRYGIVSAFRSVALDGALLDASLDKTEFMDLSPRYFGGIQNSLKYKNLSLDFSITFTGRDGINFLGSQGSPYGAVNANTTTVALRRWRKPGDITDVPRAATFDNQILFNFRPSTGAYSDASFARLTSAGLSYTLPPKALEKLRLKGLRLSVQGTNLFTLSKYKDLDPENLGSGAAPLRIFTTTLNVTF